MFSQGKPYRQFFRSNYPNFVFELVALIFQFIFFIMKVLLIHKKILKNLL